jgi:hypothetical protein
MMKIDGHTEGGEIERGKKGFKMRALILILSFICDKYSYS